MLKITFISTGTTSTQTPVMATLSYELIKKYLKDNPSIEPDFPIASVFDFSIMYSTIQFFATDKILMRLGELTALSELKTSESPDWSKCCFPSKFAHKKTSEPLFFMIPVFERAVSVSLSKSETLDLAQNIWKITQTIEKAGTKFIFYDLPLIEPKMKKYFELAALLNSNLIIGIIDTNKVKMDQIDHEIHALENFLIDYNAYAKPSLSISGLVFNKITEKVLSEKWINLVMQNYSYPILGMIRDDPEFNKMTTQYEIPTVDAHIARIKSAKDFSATAEMISQLANNTEVFREVSSEQQQFLEEKIFSS